MSGVKVNSVRGWMRGMAAALLACSSAAWASSDVDCPPHMSALLQAGEADYCNYGVGNAVLNPYNDTRNNLFLLMLKPAQQQALNNDNLWYWDSQREPVASPFYIEAVSSAVILPAEADAFRQRYQALDDLVRSLITDQEKAAEQLKQINDYYEPPRLSVQAMQLLDFAAVLQAVPDLSADDRIALLRKKLNWESAPAAADSAAEFSEYLDAAAAFHADSYDQAQAGFEKLSTAVNAWVAEAALYNLIRVAIRRTQLSAGDSWGFFDLAAVDQAQARQVEAAIDTYLARYPQGRYAMSARHLKRRAFWLAGNRRALLNAYREAITEIRARNDHVAAARLAEEIDDKLLFAVPAIDTSGVSPHFSSAMQNIEWDNAVLAASQILFRLRKPVAQSGQSFYAPVPLAELQQHEADFRQQDAVSLYQYLLLAYRFFDEGNFAEVVKSTEDLQTGFASVDSGSLRYADFSRAFLRALALQKLERGDEARALLATLRAVARAPLLQDHFELAQAQSLEQSGRLGEVFAVQSPIQSVSLRQRILRGSASAAVLQQVLDDATVSAEEKATALAALLVKSLYTRQYSALLGYQKKYAALKLADKDGLAFLQAEEIASGDGFKCPRWSAVLEEMTSEKPSPLARVCVGERLRTLEDNGVAPAEYSAGELGGSADGFGKRDLGRLSLYLPLIGNKEAQGEVEAFALRRALYCFATAGYNHCGNEEIPPEQRKGWFNRLKSVYAESHWSKQQKYYW